MDLITHALLGSAVACAVAPEQPRMRTRERLLLGGIAAAFPDIDFVAFPIDPLRFLADWHQGPTHSVVLLPLWAILIGGVLPAALGRRNAFAEAALVSALALASHIAADLITVYGTAILYPLSESRWSFDTTFIIDPVFTGIVLIALASGIWTRRRRFAGIGLAVVCLYVGGQAWLQQRALEIGRMTAVEQGLAIERLSALPQPLSPFNWKLIGSSGPLYYEAHVNLHGHRPWVPPLPFRERLVELAGAYRPAAQLVWRIRHRFGDQAEQRALVEQLWNEPRFAPFRKFAIYPSLSRIDHDGPETCVWFTDLRYDLPALPDTFRYGFCRDSVEQPWRLYRLRYFSERARQRLSP